MGYSGKKNKQRGGGGWMMGVEWGLTHPTSLPFPRIFSFFDSKKLHKISLSQPLEILRPKTKTRGNYTLS